MLRNEVLLGVPIGEAPAAKCQLITSINMHACGVKLHTKPINFLGSRPGSQGPRVEIKKKKKGMPLEAIGNTEKRFGREW